MTTTFLLQIKYINSLSCGGFYQVHLRLLKWPLFRDGVIGFARLRPKVCVQIVVKIYLSVRSLTRSHTQKQTFFSLRGYRSLIQLAGLERQAIGTVPGLILNE